MAIKRIEWCRHTTAVTHLADMHAPVSVIANMHRMLASKEPSALEGQHHLAQKSSPAVGCLASFSLS